MGVDFGSLIIDLEALASSSREDFVNEFWGSYENYVQTYNRLLKDLHSLRRFPSATKPSILASANTKRQNCGK
jgi:hypothetical protein